MTARIDQLELLNRADIVRAPVLPVAPSEGCTDRSFELPKGLLLGVFGLFFAYLTVMSIGFMAEGLVLPMAVNFIFVAAFAYVPAKWATMKPDARSKALYCVRFQAHGIQTDTGHASAREAATLVLLLPACILFWSIAVVTISALV